MHVIVIHLSKNIEVRKNSRKFKLDLIKNNLIGFLANYKLVQETDLNGDMQLVYISTFVH